MAAEQVGEFRAQRHGVPGHDEIIAPGENGAGTILQGNLERSNVDIASELINLILAQRAFEVNTKAITTADQMLQSANQLAR